MRPPLFILSWLAGILAAIYALSIFDVVLNHMAAALTAKDLIP